MVQVSQVGKKFHDFLLKDITFHLPAGYIMGLVGKNGAGKSSLLRLLLGVYAGDKGEILIDGIDLRWEQQQAKQKLGFVMAEEMFAGSLTLEENGLFFGKYYKDYDHERLLEDCRKFGLRTEEKLKQHSKGEQLKFQFAFALAHNPSLLILDEPTANFDPEFQQEFRQRISEFVSDGKHSVILATHNMQDLDQIADYIGFLHRGEMIFFLNRNELEGRYRLAMGEKYQLQKLPREDILYQEDGAFGSKALIRRRRWREYDPALEITVPGMEDIVYYLLQANEEWRGEFLW